MAARISTRNQATMEKSSLLLKLKACAVQLVTIFERLDWKTPCLMHTLSRTKVHRYFKTRSKDGDYSSLRSRPLKGSKGDRAIVRRSPNRELTRYDDVEQQPRSNTGSSKVE